MHHSSILEGNVTYMGEKMSNGIFLDTWDRFPNIYDIYDIYEIFQTRRLKYDHYDMSGLNITSNKVLM